MGMRLGGGNIGTSGGTLSLRTNRSPRHRVRIWSMDSLTRCGAFSNGMFICANRNGKPLPSASDMRPSARLSRDAIVEATTNGWRVYGLSAPAPRRMRLVACAIGARKLIGSRSK